METLIESRKETKRKESESQLSYHSPCLLRAALRVRETDAQRVREGDPETGWQRGIY